MVRVDRVDGFTERCCRVSCLGSPIRSPSIATATLTVSTVCHVQQFSRLHPTQDILRSLPSLGRDPETGGGVTPIVRLATKSKKVSVGAQYNDGFILLSYAADSEQSKYLNDSDWQLTTSTQVFLNPEATPWLTKMSRLFDLYIIICVDSDETEELVRKLLCSSEIIEAGFNPVKLVFTSTAAGRASCVRQLDPRVHIDSQADVVYNLQRFIPRLVKTGEDQSGFLLAPNILSIPSLAALFNDLPGYVSES
eukprot:Plantae.Rhodophyta-Purpureofilum_apyrenoidigerum.ctg21166.p2 GENE.Plantae.Rhodophyta-Purpureofilum_apyrenoidigerum.ctg21166~~Plantae.Rhodophyta-Purpureofilum_apyrenoidigerum.ctg21166.p2  ORF type:complete len:251 (+),score=24.65 Plantae.Rhodophyta-Purpureofilum_apyrenoidigerum.ctg21166:470-1222(+)